MKMILTSTDFLTPNSKNAIISMIGNISKCRVLFIPNEKVTSEKLNSSKYYDRLIDIGFTKENIYVFNYLEPDKYRNLDIDAIYKLW